MHGLYLLWWVEERHLPVAAVAAILAAGDLALTAFELPTGWLADRYGHRACLIAGSALQVAGMLCCWLGQGIAGLLAASVIVALGDAFRSGADQALLYRSCLALDRPSSFQRTEARTRAATLVALVVLLLSGGALVARWGFATGWIAETILAAIGLAIACSMVEPPAAPLMDAPADEASAEGSGEGPARLALPAMAGLAVLILPASWLAGVSGAASFFAQTAPGATPGETTILVALVTLAEAAGAMMATRLTANGRSQMILAGIATAMLIVTLVQRSAFLPVVVGLSLLLGIAEPLRATAVQRLSADHVRARVASMASACDKAVATITLLAAGAGRH